MHYTPTPGVPVNARSIKTLQKAEYELPPTVNPFTISVGGPPGLSNREHCHGMRFQTRQACSFRLYEALHAERTSFLVATVGRWNSERHVKHCKRPLCDYNRMRIAKPCLIDAPLSWCVDHCTPSTHLCTEACQPWTLTSLPTSGISTG